MNAWLKNQNPSGYLLEKGIKPSYTRRKIFEFLLKHNIHPTVDEIYQVLHEELPTLSKTTVYNTLKLFLEAKIINVINIEDNEARYEIVTSFHGHFKCTRCGKIEDFDAALTVLDAHLKDYKIQERNIYYKGICKACSIEN